MHEFNCFITLTYSPKFLPPFGSLVKSDFQLFMKRLREYYAPKRIRFFHCGEYGARFGRPHYHSILFGFDFQDKVVSGERNGYTVWRSPTLEKLWGKGLCEIGSVTFDSACYVARYIVDKVTGEKADGHYRALDVETGELVKVQPEYCTMSRRPGIGADWFARYGKEVYPSDSVLVNGSLQKPPRYYDGLYELDSPEGMKAVKRKRERMRDPSEETWERLLAREAVTLAEFNLHRKDVL